VANQAGATPNGGSRIDSIERLDLATDTGANSVTLALRDVLDMSGMNLFNSSNGWSGLGSSVARHQLVVDGGANDVLSVSGGADWIAAGTVNASISGSLQTYNVWNHSTSAAQMLVDSDISRIVL
jgi:hypothetical protein